MSQKKKGPLPVSDCTHQGISKLTKYSEVTWLKGIKVRQQSTNVNTWYPFHSELWEGSRVGENIYGTKGVGSFNALGEDQEPTLDGDGAGREAVPPLTNVEVRSLPPTAIGSGWLYLQVAPYLQEPLRM